MITMLTVERCNVFINFSALMALILGIITGYCSMIKEEELMFVPLIIGMCFVGVMFHFIEKRGDIEAGKPVDEF